ncbi:MAG: glycyl-radical enzyme activating protein [Bacillota bacterium]
MLQPPYMDLKNCSINAVAVPPLSTGEYEICSGQRMVTQAARIMRPKSATRGGAVQRGMVFDIKHYALHDGPGIRTTVFLKGCPLSCWWCHNPESQSSAAGLMLHPERCIACGRCREVCPNGAIHGESQCVRCGACVLACPAEARQMVGRTMTVDDVMSEIRKDSAFYDESRGGATFSGGEPLSQPGFLMDLLEHCRTEEIHTVVDTAGFASRSTILAVARLTDLFLYDLKHMDSICHERLTGVPNAQILDNLRCLADIGARFSIRMPIIPGINDDEANLDATGHFITSLAGTKEIDILPYHASASEKYRRLGLYYRLSEVNPPSDTRMQQIAAFLRSYGLSVRVGG